MKDIPIEAHGLDGIMPPRYSPLLINTFDAVSQLNSLKLVSSPSIVIPKRRGYPPSHGRGSFHQSRMASPAANSRKSGISRCAPALCPASHAGGHPFVAEFHDDVPEIETGFYYHGRSGRRNARRAAQEDHPICGGEARRGLYTFQSGCQCIGRYAHFRPGAGGLHQDLGFIGRGGIVLCAVLREGEYPFLV